MNEFLQAFALVSMIVFIIVLIIFTVLTTILKFKKMRNIKRLLKKIHTELELLALALREIK
jgi:Na+/H+-dicarboxylate symporter